jgi:predicted amidophosphoribosyltransferase
MTRPHWLPRLHRGRTRCPECGASTTETYCEVCGYDLVRKTRGDVSLDAIQQRRPL